jgi:hypothetical protein
LVKFPNYKANHGRNYQYRPRFHTETRRANKFSQ